MKCLSGNFKATSLDSLATLSNQSESLSDESHDSDSGAETKAKGQGQFVVKCDVYNEVPEGRKMDTIPEEEPKVSVKEILARFENLKESKVDARKSEKDCNNNHRNDRHENSKASQQESCGGNQTVKNNRNSCSNGEQRAPVSH